jgi:hypothetical protein
VYFDGKEAIMRYSKPAILRTYPAGEKIQGTEKVIALDNPNSQSAAGAYEADE